MNNICKFGCIASIALLAFAATAQESEESQTQMRSMLSFVLQGGPVGFILIALSFVGGAMVFDGFRKIKQEDLIPKDVLVQYTQFAEKARFGELLNISKAHDSLIGRIVSGGLTQGGWGIEAVREGMQQNGELEITRLRHRIGHINLLAAIAPMLGLLGTVVGMIDSFDLLGAKAGAAEATEMAVGISKALVTTCMGLVIAVPLMIFHSILRNRLTQISQIAAAECDKITRIMSVIIEQQRHSAAQPAPRPATPNHVQQKPATAPAPAVSTPNS